MYNRCIFNCSEYNKEREKEEDKKSKENRQNSFVYGEICNKKTSTGVETKS